MAVAPAKRCMRCGKVSRERCQCKSEKQRGSSAQRGYGYDWRKHRALFLKQNSLCEDCASNGKYREATEVHHVQRVSDAPERRLDSSNLMALCKQCHSIRTARGE